MTSPAASPTPSPTPAGTAEAPSRVSRRTLLASSTLAFVLAALVNDTLHELAHAVAGLVQGLVPTLSPFSVQYEPEGTAGQQIVTAAAGPAFSLLLGLVLMLVSPSWGRGVLRLFFLWLSFMAVMNFVGYLFIAPFASVGDTGQVLKLLGAPFWVYLLVALAGVAGQFWLANRFARQVRRYAATLEQERSLAFHAWILGTLVVVVLTLVEVVALGAPSDVVFVVVFYSCAVGVFAPMQFIFHRRFTPRGELLELRNVNVAALVLAVLAAASLIGLAFQGGVRLG